MCQENAAVDSGQAKQVVCKFNRQPHVCGFPTDWIGRRLARHETRSYQLLSDVNNIPKGYAEVHVQGARGPTATAHEFVLGHPLPYDGQVDDQLFVTLTKVIQEMHDRGAA
jgi:hypothetical protein